ncbi:hypothetical protein [Amycolatopsis sp. MtRt-6]|uniref:hypothetical protein n=1 Tax=Amycolatopsis sp. MtRt-6 TaxID=2792782 RepID=UPI001A8F95EB|nr:hypothetical protein [Amycolatopsis sp. MtRt-6]
MAEMADMVGAVFSGLSALSIEGVEDAGDVIVVRASTRDEATSLPHRPPQHRGGHSPHVAVVPAAGVRAAVVVVAERVAQRLEQQRATDDPAAIFRKPIQCRRRHSR